LQCLANGFFHEIATEFLSTSPSLSAGILRLCSLALVRTLELLIGVIFILFLFDEISHHYLVSILIFLFSVRVQFHPSKNSNKFFLHSEWIDSFYLEWWCY
jgi:hypothetical protein